MKKYHNRNTKKADLVFIPLIISLLLTTKIVFVVIDLASNFNWFVNSKFDSLIALNENFGFLPLMICLFLGLTTIMYYPLDMFFKELRKKRNKNFAEVKMVVCKVIKKIKEDVLIKYKKRIIIWCALTVASVLIFFGTTYNRTVITKDYRVVEYDIFNQQTAEYKIEDIKTIKYKCYYSVGRYNSSCDYQMDIEMHNGEYFMFIPEEFNGGETDHEKALFYMADIKEKVPKSKIEFEGKKYIAEVSKRKKLTEKEIRMLYELMDAD